MTDGGKRWSPWRAWRATWGRLRNDRALQVTVAATLVFFAVSVVVLFVRYGRFGDFVFDAGIFDQGLWLLSRFREPFITLRGLDLFADHSSYAAVLVVPLYWIWPDLRMSLLFAAACVAVGAVLVHAVARRLGLPRWAAATLAIAYLVHPVVLWQVYAGFHPEIVAIPAILAAYLLAHGERPWWMLAPLSVLLAAKEDAALVVVPLAVLLLFRRRSRGPAAIAALLGLAVFVLNFGVLLPHFSPTGSLIYTDRYAVLGSSLGEILRNAVTHPDRLLGAVATGDPAVYLAWTVLPMALALLAPDVLAVGVPITVVNLVSSFPYQHEARRHYTLYFIAVVALAAVVGARRLFAVVRNRRMRAVMLGLMVAGALVAQPLIGPYPWRGVGWGGAVPPAKVRQVEAALAMIPADASVAADTYLATRLSHRDVVYELPNPWTPLNWGAEGVPPLPSPGGVEWVAVLKPAVDRYVAPTLASIESSGEFTVRYEDDLLIVLQRR